MDSEIWRLQSYKIRASCPVLYEIIFEVFLVDGYTIKFVHLFRESIQIVLTAEEKINLEFHKFIRLDAYAYSFFVAGELFDFQGLQLL